MIGSVQQMLSETHSLSHRLKMHLANSATSCNPSLLRFSVLISTRYHYLWSYWDIRSKNALGVRDMVV